MPGIAIGATLCVAAPAASTLLAGGPQTPADNLEAGSISADEAPILSAGWALFAKGDPSGAFRLADDVARRAPRSTAAAALAVEAAIASTGASAALSWYDQWLGQRLMEEPQLLRTIARAMLVETARQTQNPRAQRLALQALADAGEAPVVEQLRRQAAAGRLPEAEILARAGDNGSVQILIAELEAGNANKLEVIEALAASHSPAALAPLVRALNDGLPVLRYAAADALGELGDPAAGPHLRTALGGANVHLRVKAAGALLRLGDASGVPVLQNLAKSPHANERLLAARGLSARPDEQWLGLTRTLLREADPDVRLAAAGLVAPVDPEAARAAMYALSNDPNPVIREEAASLMIEHLPGDAATLRGWMKSPDRIQRVRAAARLLTLLQ